MAIKRKKRTNRTLFYKLLKQDKFYRELYAGFSICDYKQAFNELSPERYVNKIFFNPKFVIHWSVNVDTSVILCRKKLEVIYSNFNVEDIYIYLKLHYQLNNHKNEVEYFYTLVDLINNLSFDYMNDMDFFPVYEKQYLVFGPVVHNKMNTISIARDFFYYNYSAPDLKAKHGFNFEDYHRKLKEIYQNELLPIDISLQSY